MTEAHWVQVLSDLAQRPSANRQAWLTQPTILSKALKRHCQQLSVEVLSQQFCRVDNTESTLRGEQGDDPFVRQVLLLGDGVPWTYGRVVIAPQTYQQHFSQFTALGSQLLGETLLYGNQHTTRSDFEYTAITPAHLLYQEVNNHLALTVPVLWGRRSTFYLQQAPLLVTELFLPLVPDYNDVPFS